jgi:RNA polymerase sigma-70 factor, ECF subfamily
MLSLKQKNYKEETSPHSEEYDLVYKAQKDIHAFKPLYEKHYEGIYIYFYRRCNNVDDCMDLTSKLFEKAMLNIHKFKPMGFAFKSWLYKLAHHILIDYFRDQAKTEKLWTNDSGLENIVESIEEENEKEENIEKILEALKELNHEERNLIVMKYFEKMPYELLAEIENSNVNAVRVKLHRIINKIKKEVIKQN